MIFPKFIQPESAESEFKHILLAPKPMIFYNNHNTFCLEVMKTWTGIVALKEEGKNRKIFENKEGIKMKKNSKTNSKVSSLEYWNDISTSLAIRIAIIFYVFLMCQALS